MGNSLSLDCLDAIWLHKTVLDLSVIHRIPLDVLLIVFSSNAHFVAERVHRQLCDLQCVLSKQNKSIPTGEKSHSLAYSKYSISALSTQWMKVGRTGQDNALALLLIPLRKGYPSAYSHHNPVICYAGAALFMRRRPGFGAWKQ